MEAPARPFEIRVNGQIVLSPLQESDKPALVRHLKDKEIADYTLRNPSPYTLADADHFLERTAETTARQGSPLHFAIRNAESELIGACGFEDLIAGHKAEVGYWLAKPFWGQGIATEVVGALCRFAISEWNLVRITAHVFSFNAASARVLEKNGFELEGVLKKHHRKAGRFLDSKLYALVK